MYENLILDYSNLFLVEMWNEGENTWIDYYNDAHELEWEEFESLLKEPT